MAEAATRLGLPVWTPRTLRPGTEDGDHAAELIRQARPDALPVVAYGQLIPASLLTIAEHGWVNLHFSLLPRWRGAAPVQAALAHGDQDTGATIFRIDEGLDTGPILATVTERIDSTDTADDLLARLAYSGARLLTDTMTRLDQGDIYPQPQSGEATYASKIAVADARINWASSAAEIERTIRAHTPTPGAWTLAEDTRLKLGPVTPVDDVGHPLAPGEIAYTKQVVMIGTGTTPVCLGTVQAAGKKKMAAADWARGLAEQSKPRKVV